jgi:hypothetical protein
VLFRSPISSGSVGANSAAGVSYCSNINVPYDANNPTASIHAPSFIWRFNGGGTIHRSSSVGILKKHPVFDSTQNNLFFYNNRGTNEVLTQYKYYNNTNDTINVFDFMIGLQNVYNEKYIPEKKRKDDARESGEDQKGTPEYKEGYSTVLVSELYNKMMDDMKIIIYEYRAALKKNHNATQKL